MKSNKQRRAEIMAKRDVRRERARREAKLTARRIPESIQIPSEATVVNPANLAPYNSYGDPEFVQRGYYLDVEFTCRDCGVVEVWRASQQKWWYEVAKGDVNSTAVRCRKCRRRERDRRNAARRVHLAGLAKKRT